MTERVAFITGSARGIGFAIAEALAALNYTIVLHGQSEEPAAKAAAELSAAQNAEVLPVFGDIADPKQVQQMFQEIFKKYRRLDALVANAGIHDASRLGMMSSQAVDRLFAVNAVGVVHTLQSATRLLARGTAPAVVLVSSVMGTKGAPGQAVYGATKAAVAGLVGAAAKELGPDGIRVNGVAPGYIQTDMLSTLDGAERDRLIGQTALGRLGDAKDVADVVAFLLSDAARFVTGQIIGVDGGLVI